jgi:hypothetical protein
MRQVGGPGHTSLGFRKETVCKQVPGPLFLATQSVLTFTGSFLWCSTRLSHRVSAWMLTFWPRSVCATGALCGKLSSILGFVHQMLVAPSFPLSQAKVLCDTAQHPREARLPPLRAERLRWIVALNPHQPTNRCARSAEVEKWDVVPSVFTLDDSRAAIHSQGRDFQLQCFRSPWAGRWGSLESCFTWAG